MLLLSYHTEKKDLTHQDHSLRQEDKTASNMDLVPAGWQQHTVVAGKYVQSKGLWKTCCSIDFVFYQNKKAQMDSKPTENMDHNLIPGSFLFCVQLTSDIHGAPLQKKLSCHSPNGCHRCTSVTKAIWMLLTLLYCLLVHDKKWSAQVSIRMNKNKVYVVILQDISKGSILKSITTFY